MSRIEERFKESKQLIPYVMAGYPDLEGSKKIINTLTESGCKIIEIGIPYSDPLADGPTIQRASEAALEKNTDTIDVLSLIKTTKAQQDYSPVLMVYYNLIYKFGAQKFAKAAADSGVEGVIVPDLSIEDSTEWIEAAEENGLDTIFLIAPTSSVARTEKISNVSTGFIYCVSLTGVTGARKSIPDNLVGFIERVRDKTDLPLAVGFGISDSQQAKEISAFADGIIIGSAFIDIIENGSSIDEASQSVGELAKNVITALN